MKPVSAVLLLLTMSLPVPATGQEQPAALAGQVAGDSVLTRSREAAVRVVPIPRRAVLLRTIRGGFELHRKVFQEFMAYAEANYRTVGTCFGIYPLDPDAVSKGELTWQVGVEVTVGDPGHVNAAPASRPAERIVSSLRRPAEGYELAVLPAIQAAVLSSTVERSSLDGLSMIRWMTEHGYTQTGPTRMEYLSHDEPSVKIATRIIVPVVKRERGLRLAPKP